LPAYLPNVPAATAPITAQQTQARTLAPTYATVRDGDTLSGLAQRYLGAASRWPALWWANRHLIDNPSLILPGQKLLIPVATTVTVKLARTAQAEIPAPPPVTPAAPAAAPAPAISAPQATVSYSGAPGSFQACVIARESGGNPTAVNPSSGAGGLYQFLPSTWAALGFSGLPENASVAEQNQAFQMEYAQSGTSAWSAYDGC
jgi:LysM repeat protein